MPFFRLARWASGVPLPALPVFLIIGLGLGFVLGTRDAHAQSLERVAQRLSASSQEGETGRPAQRGGNGSLQAKPASPAPTFQLQSEDQRYTLQLGGYIQGDARFFSAADQGTSQFLLRRVRPFLEGRLDSRFLFRIVPDFAGSQVALFDAYLEWNALPRLQVRAGKFKAPIGLERLQSATATLFIERGLPTNLVPTRDIGVQLSGKVQGELLQYALGLFNGAPDLANNNGDTRGDKDLVLRLFMLPLRNLETPLLQNLGVGVAGSYGRAKGTPANSELPAYRSFGQNQIFAYRGPAGTAPGAIADGPRWRIAPQAYWASGPWSLLIEWTQSAQEVRLGDVAHAAWHRAWQVATAWVFTGEKASFEGVTSVRPAGTGSGSWGAWEVALRYGSLDIDGGVFSAGVADDKQSIRAAREWVIGLNGYLNANVRVLLDYAVTTFHGGRAGGNRPDEGILAARAQLVF